MQSQMAMEELEFNAFSLRQELIQRLGRESIGERIITKIKCRDFK